MDRLVNGIRIAMTPDEIAEFEASRTPTCVVPRYSPRVLLRVFRNWGIASALIAGMDDLDYAEFTAAAFVPEDDAIVLRALGMADKSSEELTKAAAAAG